MRACLLWDIDHECRLGERAFVGFLEDLTRIWVRTGDVELAWATASRAWTLQGPKGDGGAVFRVLRRQTLIGRFESMPGRFPGEGELMLEDLIRYQRAADLGTLDLGRGDPVWGSFDPAAPDRHPAHGRTKRQVLDQLGLPFRSSPRDESYVILRMRMGRPDVPTLPEAGWCNPWWMPAPATGPRGVARDVAGLKESALAGPPRTAGLAEIVGPNGRAAARVEKDSVGRFILELV